MQNDDNPAPESRDQAHSDSFSAESHLREVEQNDSLPIGFFQVFQDEKSVRVNNELRTILGGSWEEDEIITESDLWKWIESHSEHSQQTRKDIDSALRSIQGRPSLEVQLRENAGTLLIGMAPSHSQGESGSDYQGYVIDLGPRDRSVQSQTNIIKELTVRSRKFSASIQGKLDAISENLEIWPKEVQLELLDEVREQHRMQNQLMDLSINVAGLFDTLPVYAERVDVVQLVKDEISERQIQDAILSVLLDQEIANPFVSADPALFRLALRYLLLDIQQIKLPGKLDITISDDDDLLKIDINSPRMMALPGMSLESVENPDLVSNARLFLAENLITAQGGSLQVQKTSHGEGDVYGITIFLPLEQRSRDDVFREKKLKVHAVDEGRVLMAVAHPDQQITIRDALQESGYRVDLALDGSTALDLAQRINPDLIVISRNLPGLDGLLVTQGIRRWSMVPIMMISDRSGVDDLNYAFQLGVDDYLRQPVSRDELLARARVCIRRSSSARTPLSPELFQSNLLKIDYTSRKVWVRGRIVELTPIEYNLLVYMSRHGNQIIPYEQLLENVWEGPEKGTRQGLFVHIKRLREKIEVNPKEPEIVTNKWGVGYVFTP